MARPNKPRKNPENPPGKAQLPRAAERKIFLAQLALCYERLWPRAWPFLFVVLFFLGCAWFDVWALISGYAHGVALIVLAGGALSALFHFVHGFYWPSREAALARIEADSGLHHQPLRSLSDNIALGTEDATSQALWQAHRARATAALKNMHVDGPKPNVPQADPFALRVVLVAFATLGFLTSGADWKTRLSASLHPNIELEGAKTLSLDAWITPPGYTGTPSQFLTTNDTADKPVKLTLPIGSVLSVRVAGTERAPTLRHLTKRPEAVATDRRATQPFDSDGPGSYKIEVPLEYDSTLEVNFGRRTLTSWDIDLVPDTTPIITLNGPIGVTEKSLIQLPYEAKDDYGIVTAEARFRLVQQPERLSPKNQELLLVDQNAQLVLPLTLPSGRKQAIEEAELFDLMAHPWAGNEVILTLAATDEAEQTGLSEPYVFVLPQREFFDPLARAIIEQRQKLAAAPLGNRRAVRRAIEALSLAPERFSPDAVVYLGLRTTYFRLGNRLSREDLQSIYDLLWNLALRLEDGDLSLAEQNLRDVQKRLMEALANNTSDEKIESLLAELREAIGRYMQALAEQARKAAERGEVIPGLSPDGEVVSGTDFQNMMRSIEDMARTGARSAARDMLAQLQQILESMRVGDPSAQMTETENAMSDALSGLGDIVAEQRELLDETYRASGRGGAPQAKDRNQADLASDQAELRERLEQVIGALGANTPTGLQPLDRAAEAMGDAQDALSGGNSAGAVPHESHAIDELQRGMQSLSQSLAQSMGSRMMMSGEPGEGRDPLGRRNGPTGGDMQDDTIKVPDALELQRARRILDELQRRASDRTRSEKELNYFERLLQRF